ncbi:helicase associated domain-containing protein [Streptomyces sp. NPDC052016]|uniref:helicase associated domain-containing protein n=1 Tax=Streptomyces sp. NPDC052016 TaxID=3365680 RepID=UPI0037D6F490
MAAGRARQLEKLEREGHLRVPRKHVETIVIRGDGDDSRSGDGQEERQANLGAWTSNQRSRAATLSPGRIEQLSAIGMRWTQVGEGNFRCRAVLARWLSPAARTARSRKTYTSGAVRPVQDV